MSYLVKGIFGVAAVSLALGAVQLASGHDLAASLQGLSAQEGLARAVSAQGLSASPFDSVNRAAKEDRGAVLATSLLTTRTIAFRPPGIPSTSVLVRIPAKVEARQIKRRPPPPVKSTQQKSMMAACEPVVSVLTDIAKRLQPGRCVT
jgi:hypothetical protein